MRTLLLITLACLCPLAQAAGAEAAAGDRILHRFDFEERDDGNYEDVPMYWAKVVGPGLPHYCRGRLSTDASHAGRYSFKLDLDGGSVLYRLSPDLLHVTPDARYRVAGFVRTSDLQYAKARLTAYFVDENGLMLPGSARHGTPYAAGDAPADAGGWTPVGVELSPDSPRARGIVVELGLLQPDQLGPDSQSRRQGDKELTGDLGRFRQDVRGSAWFDDVTVSRVPAVRLARGPVGNVFARSTPVRFTAVVDDRSLADLCGTAEVRDADGRRIARVAGVFRDADHAAEGAVRRDLIDFDVPHLPAGWYQATLTLSGEAGAAAASVLPVSFAVLADDDPAGPVDLRVTVDATHMAADGWADLPALLPTLAAGRVQLAVWSRQNNLDAAQSSQLDDLMRRLDPIGVRPTAVFAEPTRELAELAGGGSWRALEPLLTAPQPDSPAAELWHTSLSYLVSRHAQQLGRWQVGRDGDANLFETDPRMRLVYAAFERGIAELASRPDVAMPWPARAGLATEALPRSLALRVPADVTPAQIPLYVDEVLRQAPASAHDLSLSLEPLDPVKYGRRELMSDLAKRLTLAFASGIDRVTVPLPFDPIDSPAEARDEPAGALRTPQQPRETYLVLRTMLRHMAGCAYQGRVSAGPGVEAYLFAPPTGSNRRGVLVLWSDRAGTEAEPATLRMNLGTGARQLDLWGNATALSQSGDDRVAGRAELRVGGVPSLIVGVDADLTRMRALVRLDRTSLESSFEPHTLRLSFVNPYPTTLSGRVELRGPDGWEISFGGAGDRFSIDPAAAFDRPFEVRFPYNSYAGEKTINALFTLRTPAGSEQTIRVPLTLRLGLEDVGLSTVAWTDGGDVVVEQTVANHGTKPMAYTAFVLIADRPRQERLVVDLGPGQSTVRRFRFSDAASGISGPTEIRSGLRELEGTRILNDRVELQ